MAENIGLGEAIAGGTRLSGDFGSPITRGFQMGQQNQLAQLQRQQQEQAKLQSDMDKLGKFVTYDSNKWYNAERARKVKDFLDKNNAEIFNAWKAGDKMKVYELENQAKYEVGLQKILDNDEKVLNEGDKNSITRKQAQEVYSKKGVEGIAEENKKYWFAPLANIDAESGSFKIIHMNDPKVDKYLGREIKDKLTTLAPKKKDGSVGNANILTIDINSPEYKNAKIEVINKALGNESFVKGVINTREFKNYYDDFLAKNNILHDDADQMDLNDALVGYMNQKYNQNEYIKPILQRKATQRSGGGSGSIISNAIYYTDGNKNRWQYEVDTDGGTFVQIAGNPEAHPSFTQGSELIETYSPKIKYLGNGNFQVDYFEKLDPRLPMEKAAKPLIVTKKQMDSVFKLSEEGYKNFFPAYKAEKERIKPDTNKKPASAPAKSKKMSLPMWKKQNPNGTIAQYKQYINS